MRSESIDPVPNYPLTHPQKSIWFLEKTNPGSGISNIAATMLIDEEVDYDLISRSANIMLKRNEGFRLRFFEADGQVRQYVAPFEEYKLDYYDFSTQDKASLFAFDREQASKPFDCLNQPLFYFALIKIESSGYGFFVRIHHLISDAWSLVELGNEIMRYYYLLKRGQPLPQDANPSYLEYIEREQAYVGSARFSADKAFWRDKFRTIPETSKLKSSAKDRVGLKAKRKSFVVPEKLAQKIKAHCRENKTSVFALFFAALSLYLNRVRSLQEITIGTPVLNRTNAREKKTIGMFVGTVPLCVKVDKDLSFDEFSRGIDREWFSVLKHQKYPYDLIIKDIREQGAHVDKLFSIAVSYQNARIDQAACETKIRARWHFNDCQVESLYLHINDREDSGELILNFDYQTDLFYELEIDFIHDHIIRLLWHALDNPSRKLSRIHMLSQNEMDKVLRQFNDTTAGYPPDETLVTLFERQAVLRPGSIALTFEGQGMNYSELNGRANELADRLRSLGVGRETIVATLLPRSINLLVGILAILKAGGAYMPIDPDYPAEQIHFMLEDSKSSCLLVENRLPAGLKFNGRAVNVSHRPPAVWPANPDRVNQPGDLAYVIYTSGSTGAPKGVMIEHRNVVRLLFNDHLQFDFSEHDVWTLFHSCSFDFSVWEMYGALLYGGRLVIVPKLLARDPKEFLSLLALEKVTVLNQTPTAFYQLAEAEKAQDWPGLSLRMVIFGGEALKPIQLQTFRKRHNHVRLINMYGITETTVHVTFLELTDEHIEKNICNIGRPIPTTTVYILDSELNPLPVGVPGEICVGGAGVGRGYLGQPELTARRFVANPHCPGDVLYRSGDLARFFAQGDLEYLGRIDNQVKIRGHRIELGEVEFKLMKHPKVREAVVLPRASASGSLQLAAWVVSEEAICASDLSDFLAGQMPSYMLPAAYARVERMPLTSNGKIDRKRLPELSPGAFVRKEYEAPRNAAEAEMARVWQEVLEIDSISINDNFFQIGGDSLNAIKAITLMGQGVTFADLYQHPTIKTLSAAIDQKSVSREGEFLLRMAGESPAAETSLICFPYGGGNGLTYKDLADSVSRLHPGCQIYSVNLPGHDPGLKRQLMPVQTLAPKLAAEIDSTVTGHIVLYGHCVGSALTLAVAHHLHQAGRPVKAVFLGGILPPNRLTHIVGPFDPWRVVSNRNIFRFLAQLGLPADQITDEHRDMVTRAFRHDVKCYYQHFFDLERQKHEKLPIPLICIVGDQDRMTINYGLAHKRWRRYAHHVRLQVLRKAGHYFMKTHCNELAAILTAEQA